MNNGLIINNYYPLSFSKGILRMVLPNSGEAKPMTSEISSPALLYKKGDSILEWKMVRNLKYQLSHTGLLDDPHTQLLRISFFFSLSLREII